MTLPLSSSLVEGIGYIAGALTTVAFLPQLIKTWRSRSADDLSATMLTVFMIGIVLWTVYGMALASWPLVISNVVTLALTGLLLLLKVRYALASRRCSSWRARPRIGRG